MGSRGVGIALIAIGAVVIVVGALVYLGAFNWFGRVPGDVRVESDRVRVYAPIVSMLVLSAVLSVVLYLLRRFF